MKSAEAMIAWNSSRPERYVRSGDAGPGAIEVGYWPDTEHWSAKYDYTSGACYVERRELSPAEQDMMLFIDFHTMIVRDGVDPQVAHNEFLKIDEYRRRISPDIPGAEE